MMQDFSQSLQIVTNNTIVTVFLSVLIFSSLWRSSIGGSCWLRVEDTGLCNGLLEMGVSQDECCGQGAVNAGWTPQNHYTDGRLFYLQYLAGGAPQCTTCHPSCENVQCSDRHRRCRVKDGRARCVCSPDCSGHDHRQRGFVCGNDGDTYRNYCTLLKMNCRRDRSVEVDYYGRCRFSCSRVTCHGGKSCVEDQNGVPHCVQCGLNEPCGQASPAHRLCGADGVTYDSACEFRKATCVNGRSIGLAYRGQCDSSLSCSTLQCPPGKKCLLNPTTGGPQCVTCEEICSTLSATNPICGSDGTTYTSWCSKQQASCSQGFVITTSHYGPCHQEDLVSSFPAQSDDYEAYEDHS